MQTSHLIIGVGNRWRQDDGVGLVVAEQINGLRLPGVTVCLYAGEYSGLLDVWQGANCVIVIDAARGLKASTIYRLDAHEGCLPADLFGCSSHDFGVAQAVELARTLGRLPERLIVYGVGTQHFGMGQGLSAEVAAAVPSVIDAIHRELMMIADMGTTA